MRYLSVFSGIEAATNAQGDAQFRGVTKKEGE